MTVGQLVASLASSLLDAGTPPPPLPQVVGTKMRQHIAKCPGSQRAKSVPVRIRVIGPRKNQG